MPYQDLIRPRGGVLSQKYGHPVFGFCTTLEPNGMATIIVCSWGLKLPPINVESGESQKFMTSTVTIDLSQVTDSLTHTGGHTLELVQLSWES